MPLVTYLLVALVAYVLGSIPFGFLLVWLFRKEDIRSKGSGNIGATNVVRSGAKGLGALTFLLDACKGYVAALLAVQIGLLPVLAPAPRANIAAVAAMCAVLGHMYTVWLGFKGGKGVATAFGVFVALVTLGGAGFAGVLRCGVRAVAVCVAGVDPGSGSVSGLCPAAAPCDVWRVADHGDFSRSRRL